MNSVYIIPPSASSPPPLLHFSTRQWLYQNKRHTQILPPACSLRRRNDTSRSKRTRPSPDHDLQMVIDVNRIKTQASSSLTTLFNSTQLKLRQFVSSGKDAYTDLQTLITVDNNQRVIISCRRSSVLFLGNLVIWSFVIALGFRVLVQLGSRLGFLGRFGVGYGTVVRRDRSLGGREVVVGKKKKRDPSLRVLSNPLSSVRGTLASVSEVGTKNRVRTEEKLPRWWPVLLPPPTWTMNKEEYQRKANRLIRGTIDIPQISINVMVMLYFLKSHFVNLISSDHGQ